MQAFQKCLLDFPPVLVVSVRAQKSESTSESGCKKVTPALGLHYSLPLGCCGLTALPLIASQTVIVALPLSPFKGQNLFIGHPRLGYTLGPL